MIYFETGATYANTTKALIAYDSYVDSINVTATDLNALNDYTFDYWKANSSGSITFDINIGSEYAKKTTNYLAIAAHNLSESLNDNPGTDAFKLQYYNGSSWADAAKLDQSDITDKSPLIHHLAHTQAQKWRLVMDSAFQYVRLGVVKLGKILEMQRTVYKSADNVPLSRDETTIPQRSESGQFLGMVMTRQFNVGSIQWNHLTYQWDRDNFDPFAVRSALHPFFIAWRPSDFPGECVFAWRRNNIKPANTGPRGMMSVSLDMEGIA